MNLTVTRDLFGALVLGPAGEPPSDVERAVLGVAGGHLTWHVLDLDAPPTAVLDEPDAAQSWLWALYGEEAAGAVAEGRAGSVPYAPVLPRLAADAVLLAYAHWAARWWPASVIDGIPPLDPGLLAAEIVALTTACDLLGVDEDDTAPESAAPAPDPVAPAIPTPAPGAYALAAGGTPPTAGRILSTGTGGTDWRRYPPGILDAAEQAVSWRLTRVASRTLITVSAAPAPRASAPPPHLAPRAAVPRDRADLPLVLGPDGWTGEAPLTGGGPVETVDVYVPGFAPAAPPNGPDDATGPTSRHRVRTLARRRLAQATPTTAGPNPPPPLRAEIAAARTDPDY